MDMFLHKYHDPTDCYIVLDLGRIDCVRTYVIGICFVKRNIFGIIDLINDQISFFLICVRT